VPFVVAPRPDPEWLRHYQERWAAANVVRERGLVFPVRRVYQFETPMPRSAFDKTAFYNEFYAPQRSHFFPAAAERLGISRATAYTHLLDVFSEDRGPTTRRNWRGSSCSRPCRNATRRSRAAALQKIGRLH
jgi:hypothetical protein